MYVQRDLRGIVTFDTPDEAGQEVAAAEEELNAEGPHQFGTISRTDQSVCNGVRA